MNVHYLQHVPFEHPGALLEYFRSKGHVVTGTHLYLGQKCPPASAYDWLVIMGGPMNIYEEKRYPWFTEEKVCIREAVAREKKVLGICLGAQLIADVLGAKIYRNPYREIGWFPVVVTPGDGRANMIRDFPDQFEAFHWHGDTFELPEGAVHLFRSEACINQGFHFRDRVLALQFHLETTPELAQALINHGKEEMDGSRYVQTEQEMMASAEKFRSLNHMVYSLLDNWIGK